MSSFLTEWQLNGLSVIVRSAVIPFFQSLSPDYQQPAANNESVPYDSRPVALPSQSMLNDICQGAGLVAQLARAWVPQVEVAQMSNWDLSRLNALCSSTRHCSNSFADGAAELPASDQYLLARLISPLSRARCAERLKDA